MPLLSKMRLTASALAEGWTKLTVSWAPTLKLFQFSAACWLDCRMVVLLPCWLMLAVPATTCPPVGAASAGPPSASAVMAAAAAASLRRLPLPHPRDVSATATQAFRTWLQTRR